MTPLLRTVVRAVALVLHGADRAVALLLLGLVRCYQLLVSPLLGPVCRYGPSCSSYGATALREHGAAVGTWLTARRLLRCHPWARGGWDPVPSRSARARARRAHTGSGRPAPQDASSRHHRDHGPARPEPARTR